MIKPKADPGTIIFVLDNEKVVWEKGKLTGDEYLKKMISDAIAYAEKNDPDIDLSHLMPNYSAPESKFMSDPLTVMGVISKYLPYVRYDANDISRYYDWNPNFKY